MTAMRGWLEILDELGLPVPEAEPQAVAEWIRKRQKAVDRLQALDGTELSEGEKSAIRLRLDEEQKRGEAVIASVRESQKALRSQVVKAAQGRAALRGYRTAPEAEPKTQGRTA